MNIVPRILLWLYALGVAIVSIAFLLQYMDVGVFGSNFQVFEAGAVTAVVFLLVSIFFLFYRSRGYNREPQTVTHKMDHGDVKITYETLEQLAARSAAKIRGIAELKTRVRAMEGGAVRIAVRFSVEPDLDIPKITAELQKSVKSYIEATAGIPVEQVMVYVTQLAVPKDVVKKRVE